MAAEKKSITTPAEQGGSPKLPDFVYCWCLNCKADHAADVTDRSPIPTVYSTHRIMTTRCIECQSRTVHVYMVEMNADLSPKYLPVCRFTSKDSALDYILNVLAYGAPQKKPSHK